MKIKKLGAAQLDCLDNLDRGSTWRYGWPNSWVWDSAAGTKRILDTLVSYGLAVCSNGEYSISEAGKAHLISFKAIKKSNLGKSNALHR